MAAIVRALLVGSILAAALPGPTSAADPRFHALEGRPEPSPLQPRVDSAQDGSVFDIPPGEYRGTLLIENKRGLTLRARPGTVTLVSSNPRADIVHIHDSSSIVLQGLRMGHDVEVWCVGNTVTIRKSKNVTIDRCDIHGSGVNGIDAMNSSQLTIRSSHIHDCTYTAALLTEVEDLIVEHNLFRRITQTQTSNQGLALSGIGGKVSIKRNTFVDNTSIPITLEGSDAQKPAPEVSIAISDNLFVGNSVPLEDETGALEIRDVSEPRYNHPVIGKTTISGNCFERTADRPAVDNRCSPGAKMSGNQADEIVLDPNYQVTQSKTCKGKGAPKLRWLPASARHDDPRQQGPLRGLRDVLGFKPSADLLVDRLYPIGFSRQGLLAYLIEHADEAVGEYLWSFQVRSLVDDKIKDSIRWDQFDDESRMQVQELNAVLRHRGGRIVEALQSNGIDSASAIKLHRFPMLLARGDRYTAAIETKKGKEPESLEHRVVLNSWRLGRKTVGTIHASTLYPGLDAPEVLGYLRSPFGKRIVVAVAITRRGYEGPPNVRTFHLFGAHLTAGYKQKRRTR